MPRTVTKGRPSHILRSWGKLLAISAEVAVRRVWGKPLTPDWSMDFEIGTLFWRGQFRHAMQMPDIAEGRAYFDSLQTITDEVYRVAWQAVAVPRGDWITPAVTGEHVIYYLHGGGYAFYGGISRRFAAMLAHNLAARVFALDYRLTPEHPHPAQIDDAVAGYRYLLDQGIAPERIVVIGDSAGGHLMLMLLVALRSAGIAQPCLAIGLCPWTDIGDRGESLHRNDQFDLVQGWMALRFGQWLQGSSAIGRAALSPIAQDYRGTAPIYLQGGGREVLIDMIRDFAGQHRTMLDVWPTMTHCFQAHGKTRVESALALSRVADAIEWRKSGRKWAEFPHGPFTETCPG